MAVLDIPNLPPLKAVLSGNSYWLCTFKNKVVDGVSKPIKGQTKAVGKIIGLKSKTGLIEWKDDFLKAYPLLEQLDVYRELDTKKTGNSKLSKFKLVFKAKDELISLTKAIKLKKLAAGATFAIDYIIANTPFATALARTFNKYKRDYKLLSLAYYLYLVQKSSMQGYYTFASTTRLPYQRPLDATQISRLFASITDDEINKFFLQLNKLITTQEEANVGKTNVYYALDSTSISTYARKISKAQFGYNKDGDDLRQINVLMLVNQETGQPLYYRAYDGDVPDVSTVCHTLKEYARINLNRQAIIVSDKGYSSVININKFLQSDTKFLLNLKTSLSFCKNLIFENLNKILDISNYNSTYNNYMLTVQIN